LDGTGAAVASQVHEVVVFNVDPWLAGPRTARLDRCGTTSLDLDVRDVEDDVVTVEIVSDDFPGQVRLEGRTLRVSTDASVEHGDYSADLLLEDEDGSASIETIASNVGPLGWTIPCYYTDPSEQTVHAE